MPAFPIVDSHLHIWDRDRLSYSWLKNDNLLDRTFGLCDYDKARGPVEVAAMVFVECDVDPSDSIAEARWVASVAGTDHRIRAMVAHAPLELGDAVRPHLDLLSEIQLTRGVRRLLQQEPDPEYCLRSDFIEGVKSLKDYGWSFDICITHRQLESAIKLVRLLPNIHFVLDHIGKPAIRDGQIEPWATQMVELARSENVSCKISGVATEADHRIWQISDISPFMMTALEAFGIRRLMFASDWPVATKATTFGAWVDAVDQVFSELSLDEQRALYVDNACNVYRFQPVP